MIRECVRDVALRQVCQQALATYAEGRTLLECAMRADIIAPHLYAETE
jgi:hypothetical protein